MFVSATIAHPPATHGNDHLALPTINVLMYTTLVQPPNALLASDPPHSFASLFVNDAAPLRARHGSTHTHVRDLRRFSDCSPAPAAEQPLCSAVLLRVETSHTVPARLALAGLPAAGRRDLVGQPVEVREVDAAFGAPVAPEDWQHAGRLPGAARPGGGGQRGTSATVVGSRTQSGALRSRPLVLPALQGQADDRPVARPARSGWPHARSRAGGPAGRGSPGQPGADADGERRGRDATDPS